MALDAHGNPVDENANSNANKSSKPKSGHITTTVKGKKDITLEFAQLAGKGYPDPVNLEG
jgi:hypothetical protein